MMKIKIYIVLLAVLMSLNVSAQSRKSRGVPACPFMQEFTQPDGTVISLKMRGDAVFSWYETEDGQKVLKDKDQWFTFVKKDNKGYMVPSAVKLGKALNSNSLKANAEKAKDIFFSESQMNGFEDAYFSDASSERTNFVTSNRTSTVQKSSILFPSKGTRKSLMILAQFADVPSDVDASIYHDIMNMVNYDGTGSFRDYYLENSYGQLDISTDIVKNSTGDYVWVTLPHPMAYYGRNTGSNDNDDNPRQMVIDAVNAADEFVNFADYDNNNDGFVDNVMIIHSGFGEEAGASDDCIWSHRFFLTANGNPAEVCDGVKINDYITFPEKSGRSGVNPTHIGVLVHEFGHAMGLPDYYDTDYEKSGGQTYGLGKWDVMSGGSWNNNGITPAQHNAYSKYFLGWIDLPILNDETNPTNGKVELKSITDNKEGAAYRINTKTADEYFVVANRQQTGFNEYVPGHGMLVFHVDRTNLTPWNYNNVNDDPSHMYMKLLPAGRSYTSNSSIPFPGTSNVTELSDYTDPSLYSWNGDKTNAFFSDIKEEDGIVSFNFAPNAMNDVSLSINFILNSKKINMEGTVLTFTSVSDPNIQFISTVNAENKCLVNDIELGAYNITIGEADREVDGEMIYFDTKYASVQINSTEASITIKQAKTLKVFLRYNNKVVDIDFSDVPVSIVRGTRDAVEGILNADGVCAFKDLYPGKYDLTFGLDNSTIIVDGVETEVLFNTFYEDVNFNVPNVNFELTLAQELNFSYSYDGVDKLDLDFSGDKISIYSTVEANNRADISLDENGTCMVADLPFGDYVITTSIADKVASINGRNAYLSFSDSYEITINTLHMDIPLKLKVISNSDDLKVFPNPTSGYTQIEANFNEGSILRVYDMTGLLVIEKVLAGSDLQNGSLHGLDLSGLNAGIYNIIIVDGDIKLKKRVVKQ